jgi:hypothetical protein
MMYLHAKYYMPLFGNELIIFDKQEAKRNYGTAAPLTLKSDPNKRRTVAEQLLLHVVAIPLIGLNAITHCLKLKIRNLKKTGKPVQAFKGKIRRHHSFAYIGYFLALRKDIVPKIKARNNIYFSGGPFMH